MKDRVLVVAHDAGEAEMIGAYIEKHKNDTAFKAFVGGPAETVFLRRKIPFERLENIFQCLETQPAAEYILMGTGIGGSKSISRVVKKARTVHIKTIGYLDHWTIFKKRFGFPAKGWKESIPDELWAGDPYAYDIAMKHFNDRPIRLVSNAQFEEIQERFRSFQKGVEEKNILFLGEPVSYNPENIFASVLSTLKDHNETSTIILRTHPNEPSSAYQAQIDMFSDSLDIKRYTSKYLLSDIAQARIVIGIETMALAIASLCGKKTISVIFGSDRECVVPFPDIIQVHDAKDILVHL